MRRNLHWRSQIRATRIYTVQGDFHGVSAYRHKLYIYQASSSHLFYAPHFGSDKAREFENKNLASSYRNSGNSPKAALGYFKTNGFRRLTAIWGILRLPPTYIVAPLAFLFRADSRQNSMKLDRSFRLICLSGREVSRYWTSTSNPEIKGPSDQTMFVSGKLK